METLGHQKKNLVLILLKHTQNFASVYIIMLILVICLLMEKKHLNLKPTLKILTFQLKFVSEVYLRFITTESRELSLNGNLYDFSVNYNSVDKSDKLFIHKYLMTKINIK